MASRKVVNEVPVPSGTIILVSVTACNRDKSLWGENADKFRLQLPPSLCSSQCWQAMAQPLQLGWSVRTRYQLQPPSTTEEEWHNNPAFSSIPAHAGAILACYPLRPGDGFLGMLYVYRCFYVN